MSNRYLTLLTLLAPVAFCSDSGFTIGGGVGSYPNYANVTREGNSHPDATRSVPFSLGRQKNWTLRVNVTNLSVPGDHAKHDDKYVNTVYDLQWPGSDTINQTVAAAFESQSDPNFCSSVIFSTFPANVTNAWKDGTSTCSDALGESCLNALIKKYSVAAQDHAKSGNGCPSGVYPDAIPECKGTFVGDFEALGLDLLDPGANSTGMSNATLDNPSWPLKSGNGFAFRSSSAQTNNTAYFEEEVTRLHMVLLSSEGAIYPVCTRINATKLTPTSPGAAHPSPSDGAANKMYPHEWLGAAIGVAMVSYII